MAAINRRTLLASILPGAVATAAGVTALTAAGANLASAADAILPDTMPPLTLDEIDALKVGEGAEAAGLEMSSQHWRWRRRHWYGRRRWRRRRWVCWWRRGRRVCGWRYW
jgi:hypothetical protein